MSVWLKLSMFIKHKLFSKKENNKKVSNSYFGFQDYGPKS